jgi:hypothetical protein
MRDAKSGTGGKGGGRRDRRAEALRANLRRRKLQVRGRAEAAKDEAAAVTPEPGNGPPRRDEG